MERTHSVAATLIVACHGDFWLKSRFFVVLGGFWGKIRKELNNEHRMMNIKWGKAKNNM
jgi:hypothetical protein